MMNSWQQQSLQTNVGADVAQMDYVTSSHITSDDYPNDPLMINASYEELTELRPLPKRKVVDQSKPRGKRAVVGCKLTTI